VKYEILNFILASGSLGSSGQSEVNISEPEDKTR
jgi:hypothetical protein